VSRDPRLVEPQRVEQAGHSAHESPYDPLRLCVFATVALLGWLLGPAAVVVFAVVGFVGYWQARRGGLLRSRCKLGDTRLVLVYLAVVAAAGGAGIVLGLWVW
jgi:hypothetical protein